MSRRSIRSWWSSRAARDVAYAFVTLLVAAWLSARYDLFEKFAEWSERNESWEADEIVVVGSVLAIVMGVFALRRWRDALNEAEQHRIAAGERNAATSLLADAFEYAPIGMAVLDVSGQFERVNPAFCAMLARDEAQLIGMNWRDISPEREHADSQARVAALFEGTEDTVRIERAFLTSDGSERLGVVHMSLVAPTDESPAHMLAQIADITKLQQANTQLRELLASKDRFLAAISHELRTPLSAVTGLALELRDRIGEFPLQEVAEFAGIIAQQSIEVGDLVEDFLVHARADTNQIAVRRVPVDLGAETVRVLRVMQGSHPTNVTLDVDGERVIASGDDLRVRQIIRNLLQNALRHGGSKISVSTRRQDGWATLAVIDDGDGISDEQLEGVFKPFEQAHPDPGLTESIGVGLYISRTLARLMGGDITYHRGAGRTHFLLKLPHLDELTRAPTTSDHSSGTQLLPTDLRPGPTERI